MSQCATAALDIDEDAAWSALVSTLEQGLAADGELDGPDAARDLLVHFLCIPDSRQAAWVEHPLAVLLALAAGAVMAGIRSFTVIAGWVEDAPRNLLSWLYVRCEYAVPLGPLSKTTLWRLVTGVDADALDLTIGACCWPAPPHSTRPIPCPTPCPTLSQTRRTSPARLIPP